MSGDVKRRRREREKSLKTRRKRRGRKIDERSTEGREATTGSKLAFHEC